MIGVRGGLTPVSVARAHKRQNTGLTGKCSSVCFLLCVLKFGFRRFFIPVPTVTPLSTYMIHIRSTGGVGLPDTVISKIDVYVFAIANFRATVVDGFPRHF